MSWNYSDWEEDNQDRAHSNYVYTQWKDFLSTLDSFDLSCTNTQRLLAKLGLDKIDEPLLAKYLVDERTARDKHHLASQGLVSQIDFREVLTGEYNISEDEIHRQMSRSSAVEKLHLQNEHKAQNPQEATSKPSRQLSFFEAGLIEDPLESTSTTKTDTKDPTQV